MDDFEDGLILGMILTDRPEGPGNGWWVWFVVILVLGLAIYGFAMVV